MDVLFTIIRKNLLALLLSLCASGVAQSGHVWWFGSGAAPFNSTASAGVPPMALTQLGAGDIDTGEADDRWTACRQGITSVAVFDKGTGLKYPNDTGNPLSESYAIELLFQLSSAEGGSYRRIVGFYNLNPVIEPVHANMGIYIRSDNQLAFLAHDSATQVLPGAFGTDDIWHHLIFVRDGATDTVTVYHNGVQKGYFSDLGNHLIPQLSNERAISFFKDDDQWGGEETSGKLAKIAVYNYALSGQQVNNLFSFPCTTSPLGTGSAPVAESPFWKTTGNAAIASSNFLGTTTDAPVILKANAAEAFRILPTGQVGMGDSMVRMGYQLAVDGTVLAEKLTVKAPGNWPDYVFDSTYYLLPLEEVKQYIAQYKHLPGVPSAKEVMQNGIDITAVQVAILKKIEELTLYLLETKQKLNEKEKKIHELERKNQ